MPDSPRVGVDLVVVAAGEAFIAEEMDGMVVDAGDLLLSLDVLQAVGLVPAGWEDIKGDLAADREAAQMSMGRNGQGSIDLHEAIVRELFLQGVNQVPSDVVRLVVSRPVRDSPSTSRR